MFQVTIFGIDKSILLPYQFFRFLERAKNAYLKLKEGILKKRGAYIHFIVCFLTKNDDEKVTFFFDAIKRKIVFIDLTVILQEK